jgi:dihydropteroate synthase
MSNDNLRIMPLPSGRSIDFRSGPLVMGIVNCTPDSFYPASRLPVADTALRGALEMIEAGAEILDIGGESTRPGAEYVDEDEQIRRVVPVVSGIRSRSPVLISVDTRLSTVARAALDAGADIVNDVSGLTDDPRMVDLVAEARCPVVIMHMRGTSKTMQQNPEYDDTVSEVLNELEARVRRAVDGGVDRRLVIVDPGIGFGKRGDDNLRIVKHIARFRGLGCPVLLGASRKSFIDAVVRRPVDERLAGTLAAEAWAVIEGVDILRVHDVRETVDLVRTLTAIRNVMP